MAIEIIVSADSEKRLRNLNVEIVAAVAQRDHGRRLMDLLAEQRALATALAPGLTTFTRADVRATIQQAILIATSERERLQRVLGDCQSRAAVISAYLTHQVVSSSEDVRA